MNDTARPPQPNRPVTTPTAGLAGRGRRLATLCLAAVVPLLGLGRAAAATAGGATTTDVQFLSGHGTDDAVNWDFYCTGGRNSGFWTKIPVPSCWELEGFGNYQYGLQARGKHAQPPASEEGRYRYRFDVPAAWRGRVVRIVFEGSMTDTHAWINGQPAGPVHQGAFYQFQYDISSLLHYGAANLLEVTVDKESANKSVNAAERRGDFWNFGGIFRPVYLEALPAHYIDRVAIDARASGRFHADVYVGAATPGAEVTAQILDASGRPFGAPFQAPVRDGRADLNATLASPRLWTAETPNLYTARFSLRADGTVQHVVDQSFGFRTFQVRPHDGLYLNGRKIRLKGVNRHSFWPETGRALDPARNLADVRLIKEMNMNAVRMSHYPPDADFLNDCDKLGLYVLDELTGWHGHYDTTVGKKLVAEMVKRDVNHPSILFWDNGNETGWNTALDGEYDKWDPQHRDVLHPWANFGGVDTAHYRSYAQTQQHLATGDVFMPTEFLHGLFDGGSGAGLADYWKIMRAAPNGAGGFLWSFADEGVARTDEGGRIDNVGNFAPDGIVGPHHEREGSFNAVREIWSPIVIDEPTRLPANFDGTLHVENQYDFTPLNDCTFQWTLALFAPPDADNAGHAVFARGVVRGPDVAPNAAGTLKLLLPPEWREADVLYVTARNPFGDKVWTWSWPVHATPVRLRDSIPNRGDHATFRETPHALVVQAGALELTFNRANGELARVVRGGQLVSLANGPRLIAMRRADRQPDGTVVKLPKVPKGADRTYRDVSGPSTLRSLTARTDGADVVVEADYTGGLRQARWTIAPDGGVRLDYSYLYDTYVDLLGVEFDYPEGDMRDIRWLGYGPYRVWQNRLQGTTLDVWQNAYNDPTPGVSFTYPEFKGFFRGWSWADFTTSQGHLRIANDSPGMYLGVYTPKDGAGKLLYTFPPMGLSFLDVIPPVRNKVNATDLVGPSSQPQRLEGLQHRTVRFRFNLN